MSNIYPVPDSFRQNALIDQQEYERIYRESVENSEQNAWIGPGSPA